MPAGFHAPSERLRVRVRGLVQGVGFRPYVYALAERHRLAGWVMNDPEGVLLEVEGPAVRGFLDELPARKPPAARIDRLEVDRLPPDGGRGFTIRTSAATGATLTAIGPDLATCPACLEDLFNPADRRWRYPFVTCAHCGPRWTISEGVPYDRPLTSMAGFAMCPDCAAEYGDPRDRRFHAEPIACPACGPRLELPVDSILAAIRAGRIVAIKGLGGYQLACDARNAAAVSALRARKQRDAKPFAVMVASLAAARRLAHVDRAEADLLARPERPIVLVEPRASAGLADAVGPGLGTLGLMLPAAPLHYLLFHEAAGRPAGTGWLDTAPPDLALVMTSANPGGAPILIDDAEARAGLAGIADLVVGHDRPIVARADDSVTRVVAGAPLLLRRARGYVPLPIRLPDKGPSVLGVGGFLKTTLCLTRGDEAFLSPHVGDLDHPAALTFHGACDRRLREALRTAPAAVAHDLHPDFPSTRYTVSLGLPAIAVQHHHAHAAAVLAEHGHGGPALALVLDGVGLGTDGTVWGGELLRVDGAWFERLGHLRPLPQPGGDRAAREPWRMAAAMLADLGRAEEIATRFAGEPLAKGIVSLLERDIGCVPSSSCGRLFDAVAALLGVCTRQSYEGEAAMQLESLVGRPRILEGGWQIVDGQLDLRPLAMALLDCDSHEGADLFHGTLAAGLVALAEQAARLTSLRTVALGGGCLVNKPLTEALVDGLASAGLVPLLPRQAPPGDGGLALGQAWVALQHLGEG